MKGLAITRASYITYVMYNKNNNTNAILAGDYFNSILTNRGNNMTNMHIKKYSENLLLFHKGPGLLKYQKLLNNFIQNK